ncbi:MAG: acyltransferase [Hyphomicrobiales bacterium]|nr:acyltransferase [Hyphomicrobiales bacterium]
MQPLSIDQLPDAAPLPAPADLAALNRGETRLVFADVLRGLAAAMVVVAHYGEVYVYHPDIAAVALNAPALAIGGPGWVQAILRLFNFGVLSVGLFFLISGFVIPISLTRYSGGAFAIARFFRLMPTYLFAFAASVAMVNAAARFFGAHAPFSLGDYIANALLVPDLFGATPLVNGAWTLLIEIKFYLLVALMAGPIRRGAVWPALAWGVFVFCCYGALWMNCRGAGVACWNGYGWFFGSFGWQPAFTVFMMIGVVFHAHFIGALDARRALLAGGALMALFAAAWPMTGFLAMNGNQTPSYGVALAVFLAAYSFRARIGLAPAMRFLANISYPLYLLHFTVGMTAMRLLAETGLPYLVYMPLVLACVVATSYGAHRWIEAPGMAYGKRLARGFDRKVLHASQI